MIELARFAYCRFNAIGDTQTTTALRLLCGCALHFVPCSRSGVGKLRPNYGQLIFIGLPSLYVIRSLNKSISNQFKFKIHAASVVVRTFRPFQNLSIIMRPLQKKVCPPLL